MITKDGLIAAFGGAFTTRAKVARALGYADDHAVDRLLKGLERYGKRYWSADVADRILEGVNKK